MADRTVTLNIGANIQGLQGKLRVAELNIRTFANKTDMAIQKNRGSFDQMSNGIGVMGLAGVAAFAMIVKGAAEFDKSMSKVKASGKDAADNIDSLRAAAVKAGADTQYSAAEAATAITDLAKAGVSAKDILGGGLAGALSLAASGEMDVKQAAEVTATALAQFNLEGKDASHVADLLAAGAGKAMGEVSDFGQALAQGGLVAKQTGLSIEETVGALAAFAQKGILGSDAGTSLKTMLQRLTPQSKEAADQFDKLGISAYDSQGKFVGLANFAGQLQHKMAKLSPEARNAAMSVMFGSDAVRGASVLYEEGAAGVQKWIDAVNDQGFAARQAAALTDNLSGDIERFGGSIDTVFIQSGTGASQVMRNLTQGATAAVNAFGELPGPMLSVAGLLTGAGGLGLAGVAGVMKLAGAASDARKAFKDLGISANVAKGAIGGVGAAIAIGTIALSVWASKSAEAESNTSDFASTLVVVGDKVVRTDATMAEFNQKLVDTKTGMFAWAGAGPTITDTLSKFGLSAKDAQGYLDGNAESLAKVKAAQDAYIGANAGGVSGMELSTFNLSGALDELKGNLTEAEKRTLEKAKADAADTGGAQNYSTALAAQGSEAEGAATSLEDYAKALFKSATAALQLSGTQVGFESTLDSTAKAIEKTGKAQRLANGELDLNKKKGQENQTQLNNLALSSNAYSQSLISQGASEETVQAHMERSRKAFVKQSIAAGMSAEAANRLADEYGLIPENTKANIKTTLDRTGINAWNNWHPMDHFASVNVRWGSLPKTLKIGAKGTMRVGFAGGGPAIGAGSGTSDEIDAKLSNGEHVLTASDVTKAGGQSAIYRLRAGIQSGMAKFANGGAVEPSYAGQPLSYWSGQLKTPLEFTNLQIRVRDLMHDLAEKETYNPPGRRKKAKRDKLRGLDRTAASQELTEAKAELDLAKKAAALNASKAGTIAAQTAAYEAETAAAQARTEAAQSVSSGLNKFDLGGSAVSAFTQQSDAQGNTWYTETAATGSSIAAKAKARAGEIRSFADKLSKLQKAGLSAVVLQEISGLGSEEGGKVADALLADPGAIASINGAYAEMAAASGAAGQYVAGALAAGGGTAGTMSAPNTSSMVLTAGQASSLAGGGAAVLAQFSDANVATLANAMAAAIATMTVTQQQQLAAQFRYATTGV